MITDLQNDLPSEGSFAWDPVGDTVKENQVAPHLAQLRTAAKQSEIPVMHSPCYSADDRFSLWGQPSPADKLMFSQEVFRAGTSDGGCRPQLTLDESTIVLPPHEVYKNAWAGDISVQFRQKGIDTMILAGMSANLCGISSARRRGVKAAI